MIEKRIDLYLHELIKASDYKGRHDLKVLPYESKLELIKRNEEVLLKYHRRKNEKSKGNNEGKAMRMVGDVQSYYLFDSKVYKSTKGAQKELQEELLK